MSGRRHLLMRSKPPKTAQTTDLRDFTPDARRAFDREIRGFAEELKAKVRAGADSEAVLLEDVVLAAKELRSKGGEEKSKLVSGWLRAIGFFLAGIAAAQFVRLSGEPMSTVGVVLLICDVVLASICLTCSAVLDFETRRAKSER
jgi:hypothetical protein